MEKIKIRMGFEGLLYVDNVGSSGGLALIWRDKNMAQLIAFSKNHINIVINISGMQSWRLTCFHRFLEWSKRQQSWDLLRSLKPKSPKPWCILIDFNNLLSQN